MKKSANIKSAARSIRASKGFSLVEMLVAMLMFTVVAGAAFDLFNRQAPVYSQQISTAGMSVGLNNAISQIQMNLVNAGTGEFVGSGMPNAPLGVVVTNSTSSSCNTSATYTYTSACFDKLTIITAAPAPVPALNPAAAVDATSGSLTATPAAGDTAATDATYFKSGDEVLLVNNQGSQVNAVVLSANATAVGSIIHMTFTPPAANDPMGITTNSFSKIGTSFSTTDWIVKLNSITYQVDTTTNPADPTLTSTSYTDSAGTPVQVADQVIGFKVGAALWNSYASTTTDYIYDASQYTSTTPTSSSPVSDPYDYLLVRSVRVSLIGRTPPSQAGTNVFRNGFDGGPYQIQGASIIVNPRNMSMNDN